MTEQTVDLNSTQCVRDIAEIGSTTVQNICSGAVHTVPWGHLDWIGFLGLSALGLALVTMISSFVVMIWRDMR